MSHKPDPGKNVSLTIDGISITVPEGTKILDAARKANIIIPTLCDHPDLCRRAVCRLCVVECDGRGKLLAACANDVWEGVKIVTHNNRIDSIRKTIIKLLLANHPQECLSCAASTDCALQSLAEVYGIREIPFRRDARRDAMNRQPVGKGIALLRDMDKCIKCGRCTEACQEIQTVRAINSSHRSVNYSITTAYGMSLEDSPCVSCGQCETVCPVGAICENDQSAAVLAALKSNERPMTAMFSGALCAQLDNLLGLPAGTADAGKTVTALKRLGFDKVYDSRVPLKLAAAELILELRDRVKNNGKRSLPIISACSQSAVKFIENFYPDLTSLLSPCGSPREIMRSYLKDEKTVSIEPCISNKSMPDITLTVKELARMFRLAGVDFKALPESPFDTFNDGHGVKEQSADLSGIRCLPVNGLGKARKILDSVRKGECDASLIEIRSCPSADGRAECVSICSVVYETIQTN
jgi:iron only hydrogenase large subunit-like protein